MHNFGDFSSPAALGIYADALDAVRPEVISGRSGPTCCRSEQLDDDQRRNGGNDLFRASQGNDTIDGGADNDQVVFSGARADYTVTRLADGSYTVALNDGSERRPSRMSRRATSIRISSKVGNSVRTVKNVEFLRFTDVQIDTATGAETVVGQSPVNLALAPATVKENAATGTLVGVLSATDPEGKAVSYPPHEQSGRHSSRSKAQRCTSRRGSISKP